MESLPEGTSLHPHTMLASGLSLSAIHSWAASMALSFAVVARNPHQSFSQKVRYPGSSPSFPGIDLIEDPG